LYSLWCQVSFEMETREDQKLKAAPRSTATEAQSITTDGAAKASPTSVAVVDLTEDSTVINLFGDGGGGIAIGRKRRRNSGDDTPSNRRLDNKRIATGARTVAPLNCPVCLEEMESFQRYSLSTCGHFFCKRCVHHHIQSKISDENVRLLSCPNSTCRVVLQHVDVRACTVELGDEASWKSYQEMATASFLNADNGGGQSNKKKSAVAIDCSICLESMEPDQRYSLTTCAHSFCKSCLHHYVQSKVSGKEIRLLVCPNTKCRISLDPSDVRASTLELGDTACWQTYQEVATESFLDTAVASKDKSIRRCPSNHCNFTFQYDDGNEGGQLFICPQCSGAYCLQCPVVQGRVGPAHDDTCQNVMEKVQKSQERQRKLEEWKQENDQADARFQELLQREGATGKTQQCPKCKTPITKNGGCGHMHCTSCHTNFSWGPRTM